MAQTIAIVVSNQTGEAITRTPGATLDHGEWAPDGQEPAVDALMFSVTSCGFMTGCEGTVVYSGPSGSATLYFDNPYVGSNKYNATPGGSYLVSYAGAEGTNASVTYTITKPQSTPPPDSTPPSSDPAASPPSAPPPAAALAKESEDKPDDPASFAHVPIAAGTVISISTKIWLIDLAAEYLNLQEWDPLILELTENRHGAHGEGHDAPCPGKLPTFDGVKEGVKCVRPHEAQEAAWKKKVDAMIESLIKDQQMPRPVAYAKAHATLALYEDDFYSWCGDYVSGILAKAWRLAHMPIPAADLAFLNREAISGHWKDGANLSKMLAEATSKKTNTTVPSPYLAWHDPGRHFVPTPGDIAMFNTKDGGGHIAFVAAYTNDNDFISYDGKSFDNGWKNRGFTAQQGICQNHRQGDPPLYGFIETTKLRAALGYK